MRKFENFSLFFIIFIFSNFYLIRCANETIPNSICNGRGIYDANSKICNCVKEYVTYPKDSNIQCNYELRSQSVAKFLSLFCGFLGADMFYLGFTWKGLFKCFFPLGVFFVFFQLLNYKSFKDFVSYYFVFIPIVIGALLWFIDLVMISSGLLDDSFGFPLLA